MTGPRFQKTAVGVGTVAPVPLPQRMIGLAAPCSLGVRGRKWCRLGPACRWWVAKKEPAREGRRPVGKNHSPGLGGRWGWGCWPVRLSGYQQRQPARPVREKVDVFMVISARSIVVAPSLSFWALRTDGRLPLRYRGTILLPALINEALRLFGCLLDDYL